MIQVEIVCASFYYVLKIFLVKYNDIFDDFRWRILIHFTNYSHLEVLFEDIFGLSTVSSMNTCSFIITGIYYSLDV